MTTTYRGESVYTALHYLDDDVHLYCVNDDCPAIEVYRDEDTDEVVEVIRVAWDGEPYRATRIDPGGLDRVDCPECGEEGEPV